MQLPRCLQCKIYDMQDCMIYFKHYVLADLNIEKIP